MHGLGLQEKQVGVGDAAVSYGGGEKPQYRALRDAIDGLYSDLLRPLGELEETVFRTVGLPLQTEQKEAPRFRYTAAMRRVLDDAVDLYLSEIAGPVRTREGFVEGGTTSDTPDGILQGWERFSFSVGLRHGADLADRAQTLSAERNSPATKAMLDRAFERLSENGKLRLENVRDEIHGILAGATEAGLGPLDAARQLSKRFDQYRRYEFERLARTEAAFASIEGSRLQMAEIGVRYCRWLLQPTACVICQSFDGLIIGIEETDRHPPAHPSCLCDLAPA